MQAWPLASSHEFDQLPCSNLLHGAELPCMPWGSDRQPCTTLHLPQPFRKKSVAVQVRGVLKMRSPKAKRIRSVNKNKAVVETLNRYFPQDRAGFGKSECKSAKLDM